MKKDFNNKVLHSIIRKLLSFYNMLFKSKVGKIAVSSFICFAFGSLATSVIIASYSQLKQNHGQGGLETSSVPVYYDDKEEMELVYEEKNINFKELSSVSAILESENKTDVEEKNQTEKVQVTEQAEVKNDKPAAKQSNQLTYFTYRVKSGDMIGKIAETYNVTQDAIISVNNIKQSRLIQVGQYIKIPSMTGILYTVKGDDETPQTLADKYEISAEKCALVNSTKVEKAFTKGSTIFLPDAQLDWATRQEINGDLFRRPLRARYYLSSSYGWRNSPITGNRSFHGGVDMACSTGTPVYAALDGTVTSTGYNATYGNYVIITHHSGYKTLYGHLSAITCKRGNFVYTTTQIGRVGSTGLSTGPHLHFTVYKYNKTVNPLSLIN